MKPYKILPLEEESEWKVIDKKILNTAHAEKVINEKHLQAAIEVYL